MKKLLIILILAALIAAYFAHSAGFEPVTMADLSPTGGAGDPLYVVRADRSSGRG